MESDRDANFSDYYDEELSQESEDYQVSRKKKSKSKGGEKKEWSRQRKTTVSDALLRLDSIVKRILRGTMHAVKVYFEEILKDLKKKTKIDYFTDMEQYHRYLSTYLRENFPTLSETEVIHVYGIITSIVLKKKWLEKLRSTPAHILSPETVEEMVAEVARFK